MRYLLLAIVLTTGCATSPATTATLGDAIDLQAEVTCLRVDRCEHDVGELDTCVLEAREVIGEGRDRAAPFATYDELEACLDAWYMAPCGAELPTCLE